jgi:hypothetical protein
MPSGAEGGLPKALPVPPPSAVCLVWESPEDSQPLLTIAPPVSISGLLAELADGNCLLANGCLLAAPAATAIPASLPPADGSAGLEPCPEDPPTDCECECAETPSESCANVATAGASMPLLDPTVLTPGREDW